MKIGDPQLTHSLKHPCIGFHRLCGVLFLFCLWMACIFLFIWKSAGKRLLFFVPGFLFSFHLSFFIFLLLIFFKSGGISLVPTVNPHQPYFSPQAFIFRSLRGFALSHLYRKHTERFIFICLYFLNGSDWLVSGAVTCCGDFKQQPLNQLTERKEIHVRMKSFLIYVSELFLLFIMLVNTGALRCNWY